jgi:hypothetical protein
MLNKETCKKCKRLAGTWCDDSEIFWDIGSIVTCAMDIPPNEKYPWATIREIRKDSAIPKVCPYKFEHAVLNGMTHDRA